MSIDKVTRKIYGNSDYFCNYFINMTLENIQRRVEKALATNNLYMFVTTLTDIGELRQMCSQHAKDLMSKNNSTFNFEGTDEEAEYVMTIRFIDGLESYIATMSQYLPDSSSLAEAVELYNKYHIEKSP